MSSCRAVVSIPKTCQRCGVEFGCGGSCCWCDEVALDAHAREQLRQQFSDCLCRSCLEETGKTGAGIGDRGSGIGDGVKDVNVADGTGAKARWPI